MHQAERFDNCNKWDHCVRFPFSFAFVGLYTTVCIFEVMVYIFCLVFIFLKFSLNCGPTQTMMATICRYFILDLILTALY